jgi:Fic family protein
MKYQPIFSVTGRLINRIEQIAALRERIINATVSVSWVPALQLDSKVRNAHCSTAIEGNPLTLEQVRAVEDGRDVPAVSDRAKREVVNYFAGLRHIEKRADIKTVRHEDLFDLHNILAGGGVMDQGEAGRYRTINVRVGAHFPPAHQDVSVLMFDLLSWWNDEAPKLSPVISSAILHYRFEEIHPFADGNGRAGRALALWELYRRGFDTQHIFSVDEFYWEDRPRYYAELQTVQQGDGDLTSWIEYCAEGLHRTLEQVWSRIQKFSAAGAAAKLTLRPKQEQLLALLQQKGRMTPAEIWDALKISKQGAIKILQPLLDSELVVREGTRKTGHYRLKSN